MTQLKVGDRVPDVELMLGSGETIRLSDFHGKQAVVLFFYPMNGTPICTKEACRFRDLYSEFAASGSVVLGVSAGSVESHERFAAGQQLTYPLVSDGDGKVRAAFGVKKMLAIVPPRVTFVIDRDGIVRHVLSAQLAAERHVQESLDAVNTLV